jgi:putative oxidoreductase
MSNTAQAFSADVPRGTDLSHGLAPQAHWLPRIALASVFLFHGIGKIGDLNGFAAMMDLSYAVALLVALAEVTGGLAVLAGAFVASWLTRLGALVVLPVLLGAIAMVHWGQWSFVASATHPMGGMEFQVVLTLIAAFLLIKGNDA